MSDSLQFALDELRHRGAPVTPATRAAIQRSLARFNGAISQDTVKQIVKQITDGVQSIMKPSQVDRGGERPVEEGESAASIRGKVADLTRKFSDPVALADAMNVDFKTDVATRVSRGAGRFITDQTDVDEYPAWELHRIYDRDVPRGFMRGPKGGLIEVPDDDWPSRFRDACEAAGDDDALRVLDETGRMIALKNSGVWSELGNNRDDCLGNVYPPFAYNSGYGTDGVPIKECLALGLLGADEQPEGTDFDFASLFQLPEAA